METMERWVNRLMGGDGWVDRSSPIINGQWIVRSMGVGESKFLLWEGCWTMDRWIDGSMGQWIDGSMDQWVDGSIDQWVDGLIDRWFDGSMDQWVDGQQILQAKNLQGSIDRWIDGSMD